MKVWEAAIEQTERRDLKEYLERCNMKLAESDKHIHEKNRDSARFFIISKQISMRYKYHASNGKYDIWYL